jgi:uncharacterized protein
MLYRTIFILLINFAAGCGAIKKESVLKTEYLQLMSQYREDHIRSVTSGNNTPLKPEDSPFLHFYPVNSIYKVTCLVKTDENARPFEMPTYSGITRSYIKYAACECRINNVVIRPELYKNLTQPANPLYRNLLFLPFKDETNGAETYGGGRYINLEISDIVNGKITIDFNKAYNPYCAYSEGYNCPIPPKANHFNISIPAGEKNYTGPIRQRSVD